MKLFLNDALFVSLHLRTSCSFAIMFFDERKALVLSMTEDMRGLSSCQVSFCGDYSLAVNSADLMNTKAGIGQQKPHLLSRIILES